MRTAFALKLVGILAASALVELPVGATSGGPRVNGWYPCTSTRADGGVSTESPIFECAKVELPLCHPGICESEKSIEVFVKRKVAVAAEEHGDKTIWFLEGGPGASSASMEQYMLLMHSMLDGSVNVYTVDHRGTGRSGFLSCEAAQAQADGSPGGHEILLEELSACVNDALFEIDNQTAAFSVTSAARDVDALIQLFSTSNAAGENFVYGVSYGTYLVQRLMHVASPTSIRGYILDGVLAERGFSFSRWNENILAPTRRFLEYCFDSPTCPLRFKSKARVLDELLTMYADIDGAVETNQCASAIADLSDSGVPSHHLRELFGLMVRDPWWRHLVPSLVHRIHRCTVEDFEELNLIFARISKQFFEFYGSTSSPSSQYRQAMGSRTVRGIEKGLSTTVMEIDRSTASSELLFELITTSEMWESPIPDREVLANQYLNGPFSQAAVDPARYCLLSGQLHKIDGETTRDPVCDRIKTDLEEQGFDLPPLQRPFRYALDNFTNSQAVLPNNSTALFFVGGLDFQTPLETGRDAFNNLDGENKMLVEFDNGVHGSGFMPTTDHDETTCGPTILASYIAHSGRLQDVDTSCLSQLPPLVLDDSSFGELLAQVLEQHDDLG